jgi:hypothetical protein
MHKILPWAGLVLLGFGFSIPCKAQQVWTFRSMEYGGWLNGYEENSTEWQTVNGLYKKYWFLGLGTGLDYYRFRTVPVFLSLNRQLTGKARGLFAGIDGGFNQPWDLRKSSGYGYELAQYRFRAGWYYSAYLGYRYGLGRNGRKAILLTIGYSYKQVYEEQNPVVPCPYFGSCPFNVPSQYNYENRRLSVKMGIQL